MLKFHNFFKPSVLSLNCFHIAVASQTDCPYMLWIFLIGIYHMWVYLHPVRDVNDVFSVLLVRQNIEIIKHPTTSKSGHTCIHTLKPWWAFQICIKIYLCDNCLKQNILWHKHAPILITRLTCVCKITLRDSYRTEEFIPAMPSVIMSGDAITL